MHRQARFASPCHEMAGGNSPTCLYGTIANISRSFRPNNKRQTAKLLMFGVFIFAAAFGLAIPHECAFLARCDAHRATELSQLRRFERSVRMRPPPESDTSWPMVDNLV